MQPLFRRHGGKSCYGFLRATSEACVRRGASTTCGYLLFDQTSDALCFVYRPIGSPLYEFLRIKMIFWVVLLAHTITVQQGSLCLLHPVAKTDETVYGLLTQVLPDFLVLGVVLAPDLNKPTSVAWYYFV